MEIVIDIPDKTYKVIKNTKQVSDRECWILTNAILNGKPLPKGHGKLKDVSSLLTVTDIKSDGSEFTYVPYSEIEDAPTIIGADKEE